jgi:transposase
MALLNVIRRWHERDSMPIRDIARRTGLSRNTIRKYLALQSTEIGYPERKSPSMLDEYEEVLSSWLFREVKRHRKQRKSVKQLHLDLVQLGFPGSYSRVAAFARRWRQQQQESQRLADKGTFVPLRFEPGEAFQFDWSEDYVTIKGMKTKLQVAHTKLCYSRAFILRAYLLQSHEMLFDAHTQAFRVLGGVAERGIYDNMKTAVDKIGRGKERTVNKRFLAMVGHYLYEPDFCNAASGWEKGQVEKGVRDSRHRIWHNAPDFESLEALNAWLETRCMALWQELTHPDDRTRTIHAHWLDECSKLMPVPAAFDGFVESTKRVSSTCLIHFERNRYSVPASFANRAVNLRAYPDKLVVVAESEVIAEHVRVFNRSHDDRIRTVYDWRHYLAVVKRKPGSLRNGAPFKSLPASYRRLQGMLLKRVGGDREMADILALVLLYDEHLVERAVEESLKCEIPSKQHVLNHLSRLCDVPRPPLLEAPQALQLRLEPIADAGRYDGLRERTL